MGYQNELCMCTSIQCVLQFIKWYFHLSCLVQRVQDVLHLRDPKAQDLRPKWLVPPAWSPTCKSFSQPRALIFHVFSAGSLPDMFDGQSHKDGCSPVSHGSDLAPGS